MTHFKMIHDITPAKGKWERSYAHLEFLRIGLLREMATTIEIL